MDSKIVVTSVGANVDSLIYDEDDIKAVSRCSPDEKYMRDNPIRAELYHFVPEWARLTRRLLSTWYSDKDRVVGGIEVRHCVWWNENFGSGGAWDPNGCRLVETDAEKTECECENFGAMTVILERTEAIQIEDDCKLPMLFKYLGIGFSVFFLMVMAFVTILGRSVWDMFHAIRMHVGCTWISAIIMHVITDLDSIRQDADLNLIMGFIMMYFYTASATWMMLEAHATFRAFTAGIISGRNKVYGPIGYGSPFLVLGLLFLFFADDLGVDPRCFVGWNRNAKLLYCLNNVGVAFLGVVFSIIILFNTARPQTKRKNVVADLKSQAKGTVVACFCKFIFWILATITYLYNQESDYDDPYCLFVILLGWFGFILFILLGFWSKKFRAGATSMRRKRPAELLEEDTATVSNFDSIDDTVTSPEDDNTDTVSVASTVASRPATAVSTRPATARSTRSTRSTASQPKDGSGSDDPEAGSEEDQE